MMRPASSETMRASSLSSNRSNQNRRCLSCTWTSRGGYRHWLHKPARRAWRRVRWRGFPHPGHRTRMVALAYCRTNEHSAACVGCYAAARRFLNADRVRAGWVDRLPVSGRADERDRRLRRGPQILNQRLRQMGAPQHWYEDAKGVRPGHRTLGGGWRCRALPGGRKKDT